NDFHSCFSDSLTCGVFGLAITLTLMRRVFLPFIMAGILVYLSGLDFETEQFSIGIGPRKFENVSSGHWDLFLRVVE
ncbi:hypothetical protein LCGC14_1889410, partial [marine sediment metagenome]